DGFGRYPATSGYDMATGIGAPLAAQLAVDLASYTPSTPAFATTSITARPTRDRTIRYGRSVRLRGTLTAGGGAVAGETVYIQGGPSIGIREWRVRTDSQGRWSLTLHHQLTRKTRWRAVFLGSQHRTPAVSRRHTIYVRPPLTAGVERS